MPDEQNPTARASIDQPGDEPGSPLGLRGRLGFIAGLFGLALLVFWSYRETLQYTVFGWDSWALVETSRIESWPDFVGTFSESFMDDRFGIAYFRPVLNLSLALDWALGGTDPFVYQYSQLLGFVFAVLALFGLACRVTGPKHIGAAFGACALFVLYPAFWDVIPVTCRRHDVLCIGFVSLALMSLLKTDGLQTRERWAWSGALFAFAAAGVKETGYMVVPLAGWTAWLWSGRHGFVARLKHALVVSTPILAGALLLTLVRVMALGELGGDEGASPFRPEAWKHLLTWVALPQEQQHESALALPLVGAAISGVALALLLAWLEGRAATDESRRLLRTALLAAAWVAACCAVTSTIGVGRIRSWHFVLPQAGLTLLLAALLARCSCALRREHSVVTQLTWGAVSLPLVALIGWQASYAHPLRPTDEWRQGDAEVREFLAELEQRIEAAPDGANLVVDDFPKLAPSPASGARLQMPTLLAGHSIAAWARLRFPDRRVLVLSAIGADSRLADGVVVTLASSEVLDASGVFGEFKAALGGLARDSRDVAPQMRRYREALQIAGDARAAKSALLEAFDRSAPAQRQARLAMLARWFEALADDEFAARARAASKR